MNSVRIAKSPIRGCESRRWFLPWTIFAILVLVMFSVACSTSDTVPQSSKMTEAFWRDAIGALKGFLWSPERLERRGPGARVEMREFLNEGRWFVAVFNLKADSLNLVVPVTGYVDGYDLTYVFDSTYSFDLSESETYIDSVVAAGRLGPILGGNGAPLDSILIQQVYVDVKNNGPSQGVYVGLGIEEILIKHGILWK